MIHLIIHPCFNHSLTYHSLTYHSLTHSLTHSLISCFPSPTSHLLLLPTPPKHEALERSHRSASKPRNRHHHRRNGSFRLLFRLFPFPFHLILGLYTNTERDVVEYSILDSLFPLFSCSHPAITPLSPSPPSDMEILRPKPRQGASPPRII